jgi:sulfatase maturation enzyme AslB (radical SAM superfamily)
VNFVPDPRRKLYIETSGVCNLACRFCAYSKKQDGKVIMPIATFRQVVDQATVIGFHEFGLTPLTGEPFMDPGFMTKLGTLDERPDVSGYHFYTNFIVPDRADIASLATLTRLQYVHISLYGHDPGSFQAVTRRSHSAYLRLVRNLETLHEVLRATAPHPWIRMSWRTTPEFDPDRAPVSRLHEIVQAIQQEFSVDVPVTRAYNNWGGVITTDDVEDLGMVLGPAPVKDGPCALIFYRVIVLADGRVNACACRDVNGTLVIGNVHEAPLAWILSTRNERYAQVIGEQMANRFRPVCRTCDFYQSVAVRNVVLESSGFTPDYRSLAEALRQLGMPPLTIRGTPDSRTAAHPAAMTGTGSRRSDE